MGSIPRIVEDCFGLVKLYSDGSVIRSPPIMEMSPLYEEEDDGAVIWKDYRFHAVNNLHLRLYKPAEHDSVSSGAINLPIVYFIHGGGFCFGSRAWPTFHSICLRLSSVLRAVVISPDHRLAPEHRLPSAVEDVVDALGWLRAQAANSEKSDDAWLAEGVDFDRVFIVGDSSGGNIAHQLAFRVGSGLLDMDPVRVRGFILLAPFFGGRVRMRSEEGPPEALLNLELLDRFWRLSLPLGETMDHPLVNPFGPRSPSLDSVELGPILVVAGDRELMRDRVRDYAMRLKEMGKEIEYVEFRGEEHGFYVLNPSSDATLKLLQLIKRFINQNSF